MEIQPAGGYTYSVMGIPEKEPENNPDFEETSADRNKPAKENPKLDAILPDDVPTAAAELVGDIDNYQKRMEHEWESSKSAYEQKINRIMEEFLKAGIDDMAAGEKPAKGPAQNPRHESASKKTRGADERLRNLMGELEEELRHATNPSARIPLFSKPLPEPMQLGWRGSSSKISKKMAGVAAAALVLAGGLFMTLRNPVIVEALPYTHTLGPVVWKNDIYIMDWFRRSLYVHGNKRGLPIKTIETLQNNLATGIALSEKTLWTLDALDRKILLHTLTPDHQVITSVRSPDDKPTGLFFDGTDLWSADQNAKKLYRHRGNDVEDIRDTFPLPDINVTAFAFYNNRLWLLDGKSRLANVYRLQKPLLQLGSFDLDPFVKTAMPTGFAMADDKVLVVTENPAQLVRIPISRLKKSKTESF